MGPLARLFRIIGWTVAGLVYVWFVAVRNVDRVKARKAARRRERRARLAR